MLPSRYFVVEMPWGPFAVVHSEHTVLETSLGGNIPEKVECGHWPELESKLQQYAQGHRVNFDVNINWEGIPPFTKLVLQYIYAHCGWGEAMSYGDIAIALGKPRAARAVGQAMARNRCGLIVPCHRVLASQGRIGGFSAAGGLKLKKQMLNLEGISYV